MRIVVKVGTSTLAHPTGRLNIQRMERLCKVLSDLKNAGHEIILVSSGAGNTFRRFCNQYLKILPPTNSRTMESFGT